MPAAPRVTLQTIATEAGVDISNVSRILTHDPHWRPAAATRARVLAVAKRLGYDRSNLQRHYRRQHPRTAVTWPATVQLRRGNTMTHRGRAILANVSAGGARLTRLTLKPACVPLAKHTWHISPQRGPMKASMLTATLARLTSQGAGVQWGSEVVWGKK